MGIIPFPTAGVTMTWSNFPAIQTFPTSFPHFLISICIFCSIISISNKKLTFRYLNFIFCWLQQTYVHLCFFCSLFVRFQFYFWSLVLSIADESFSFRLELWFAFCPPSFSVFFALFSLFHSHSIQTWIDANFLFFCFHSLNYVYYFSFSICFGLENEIERDK